MFFFFLDGRDVCDILESHCSFTIFTQFNWFIGKKEYVQKKQVTRIEKKNIYNRQTSIDNTYHGRWHIAEVLYRSHSLGKDFRRYRRVEARFWSRDFVTDFREMQETEITEGSGHLQSIDHNFTDAHAGYNVHREALNEAAVISGDQFHEPHALVFRLWEAG